MDNPLLQRHEFPPFSAIAPAQIGPAFEQILAENRQAIARLVSAPDSDSWAGLIEPLDELADRIGQALAPISHLNAVVSDESLRQAYNALLPRLADYNAEYDQNPLLFAAYQRLAQSPAHADLNATQQRIIEHALRDFRLGGIDLPAAQQQRYRQISARLAELSSRFSDQLLDATDDWSLTLDSAERLRGVPELAIAAARERAQGKGEAGYRLTLEFPVYQAVITHADDRDLRLEIYRAYHTRASEQSAQSPQRDNGPLIEEILALRAEQARMLGFASYAELSLATKMADSPERVEQFLRELAQRSRAKASADHAELARFAAADGIDRLEAWDVAYYSEKLRESAFAISQEALRPYFPLPRVMAGLFELIDRLFAVRFTEQSQFDRWHPDARLFALHSDDRLLGHLYLDLHARPRKRGGAWMGSLRSRFLRPQGALQRPLAAVVCNFDPPAPGLPALLTHNEVLTLFHEFGHALHHLMTEVDHPAAAGINGVEWDAVELPSQLLENWCWQSEALRLISGHYQTEEPLPDELLARLAAARHFQSGMQMVRQIEFALFDLSIHSAGHGLSVAEVQAQLDQIRAEVAVVNPPAWNRFQNGFSHIFAGGYAAGYYSYKWAELLSADAFSRFEQQGLFDRESGQAFAREILRRGGSRNALDGFIAFRGRPPQIESLLRHSGIGSESEANG
ncbi:MAG TPA: M3 family metallopeptidase [Pseudomonadales bacterium]|jgi:oligopeptidase A|nr:M3 family metallopeptidase [Pseudomonadales bacterium]HMZ70465.1 M3 family metallopeptidase [Pseudomonadales bacterium]HMZ91438.1 M3 family metallopeptidase [Pseudomonadales bacterium]HND26854.1 M3 family metallopeptidase [Pseudomonadales bacterium]HNF73683.1 M3 family metallopeptidase [Pseudomonadales bacterium]